MGHSHSSPSARNRQENIWQLSDEVRLKLRREHQVAVALGLRGERGEDVDSNAEVGRTHVRAFLCPFEAESDAAEIGCSHCHCDLTWARVLLLLRFALLLRFRQLQLPCPAYELLQLAFNRFIPNVLIL